MKCLPIFALLLALAPACLFAGTDTGAALSAGRNVATAGEVREAIALSMVAWATHPLDIPNASCTAAGVPQACCTGSTTGTCIDCGGGNCCNAPATDAECSAFARDFILPAAPSYPSLGGWAFKVEQQCVDDVDWICNPQYFPAFGDGITPAAALPGAAVIDDDVATWLSNLAADQILP